MSIKSRDTHRTNYLFYVGSGGDCWLIIRKECVIFLILRQFENAADRNECHPNTYIERKGRVEISIPGPT